jgi:ribonuclease P protein component
MAVRSLTPAVLVDVKSSARNHASESADTLALDRLKHRREFLAAAKAKKAVTSGLILQDRTRRDGSDAVRVGFTASKKVGNAVARNRAKRRMRALAHEVLTEHAQPGHDYVLIARRDTTTLHPFESLRADLKSALQRTQSLKKR